MLFVFKLKYCALRYFKRMNVRLEVKNEWLLDLVLLQRQPRSHAYPVSSLDLVLLQGYLGNHVAHFFIIATNVHP